MTDEPQNPQQIIDDATKALGQAVIKPPKKKGGKGMMIGILLFLILTLPVAVYYGSQQFKQITEGRSRAVATFCSKDCVSTLSQCKPGTQVGGIGYGDCGLGQYCCEIATPPPPTYTCVSPYTCVPSSSECRDGGGKEVSKTCANAAWKCCDFSTATTPCQRCSNTKGCTYATWTNHGASCEPVNPVQPPSYKTDCSCSPVSGGDNSACSGCAAATPTQPTTRTLDGTWHNCSYLNNTGSTGPVASGCDSSNCGGQSCGQFTFKCGVYCLAASCGAAACYDDTVGSKMYYCRTDNYSCIQTTDSYTNESACATNVQLYGQKPNTGTCYSSSASCQSACQVAGSFMYVCNTSTYQCTQTSIRYTSITACEAGND